jgi:hypothetical protein
MIELAILKTLDLPNRRASVQLADSLTTYLDDIPIATDIAASSLVTGNRVILAIPGGNIRDAVIIATWPGGTPPPSTFLALTDTPASYSGQANRIVSVRADATGLEFTAPPGGGDFFPLTRFLRAGRYYLFPLGDWTTLTLSANFLHAVPFFTPVARTATRMAIQVTTAVAGQARLGVYQDDGSVYPGSLIHDAGVVATGTTGFREITALTISLLANVLYWLVITTNANPGISASSAGTLWQILGLGPALNSPSGNSWRVAFTFGPLPATFPTGASISTTALPRIALFF